MSRPCIPPEELGSVLRLPPDSAERLHLEACARCRALLLTYREFLEDRAVPAGADPREAGASLRAAFREAAGMSGTSPVHSAAASRLGLPRDRGRLRGFRAAVDARDIRSLLGRFGRPLVLVPAAAVLLAVGFLAGYERLRPLPADELRGGESPGRGGLAPIVLLEPRPRGAGEVGLSWRSVPGAVFYEVVVMDENLADLARVSALRDTSCVLRRADLKPAPAPGALLGWQVVALRDAAPVARSPIRALRIP